MTASAWKIDYPPFTSFAELARELGVFKTALQFKVAAISDVNLLPPATGLRLAAENAEKTLKAYFFKLQHPSSAHPLKPADVLDAFAGITQAWKAIASPLRNDFVLSCPVDTFHDSALKLFEDPAALEDARKDLKISLAEAADDEIR